jgi:hypothetical protein
VIAKKVAAMKLASPQLAVPAGHDGSGEVYIAAVGGGIASDQVLSLTLSDLPHHSPVPRLTSLGLALAIVSSVRGWPRVIRRRPGRAADRKRLLARRD